MKYLILSSLAFVLFAFSNTNPRDSYTVTRVKNDYKKSIAEFTQQLEYFLSILDANANQTELQKTHLETRVKYKRFEYLITHFDNQAVKIHLNGAPLPVPVYENGQAITVEPKGLQVIDEMVFEDEVNLKELQDLVLKMRTVIDDIADFESNRYIDESHILIAMREQIIRIITLGLSGYDTPGSLNAIPEAEASLSQMLSNFRYFSTFVNDDNDIIYKEVISAFEKSITFLQTDNDFDSLDRTQYIRDYLNPLSALLLVFHDIAGIPFLNPESSREKGLNQKAFHVFDQNLFNAEAYVDFSDETDNASLRQLGASLFYDESLSLDNSMSCATCHNPSLAFTDGKQLSLSNHKVETTKRNTPTLINAVYSQRFFYDLRAQKLHQQILDVFANPNEFHMDFTTMADRLQTSPGYSKMFIDAYPKHSKAKVEINRLSIVTAISSYIKTISSFESEFDKYMRRETDQINESVKNGFNLFSGKAACGTCHFTPLFSGLVPPEFEDNETEILGVPVSKTDTILDDDIGRIGNGWKHEKLEHFTFSFKTVSVRNVDKTAPYMHNGIYNTLEEVLEFYNHGGGAGIGIDVPHQTLAADSLHLNQEDIGDIIAFMRSLSDTEFDYIIPDTLPRYLDGDGGLSDIRKNIYADSSYEYIQQSSSNRN